MQIAAANNLQVRPLPAQASASKSTGDGYSAGTAPAWTPPSQAEMAAVCQLPSGQSLAWSDFAQGRHKPGTGYSYFQGTQQEVLSLVQEHWNERQPGVGRSNLEEVVAVPVPAEKFMTTTVAVEPESPLKAELYRRRPTEEPYLRVTVAGPAQSAKFAQVILYSKDTLGKNDERSRDTDWEVVSLVASPVEKEPMDPVTMMRNMRGKAGGTQVSYTAEQLLDSIEFWSTHAKLQGA